MRKRRWYGRFVLHGSGRAGAAGKVGMSSDATLQGTAKVYVDHRSVSVDEHAGHTDLVGVGVLRSAGVKLISLAGQAMLKGTGRSVGSGSVTTAALLGYGAGRYGDATYGG